MNRPRAAEEFFGEQEKEPESSGSGSTLRAFGIGTVLCVLISTGTIYANCIIKGSFMAWAFSTPVALFLLFYLVLANIVVKALARTLALRREELTLIYVMMIISASLPTFGMVLAPVADDYQCVLLRLSREQLGRTHSAACAALDRAPGRGGDPRVLRGAIYQGATHSLGSLGRTAVLLDPLFAGSVLGVDLHDVMMRRQWVEHERLLYPMMQAPMAMVEEDDENAPGRFRIPSLLRRPQMWLGFAVPLVVITCNAFHSYYPMIPEFNLATGFNAFRGTVGFRFQLSFSLLGFSYFISRELALGIWVFYLLTQIQQGVFNTIGIQSMAKLGWFSNPQAPYLTHQALGAMLMFALLTVWRARSHLRDVFGRAFGRRETVVDSDEIMSYRTAVLGLVGGLVVMVVWLEAAGIPLLVIPLFLAVAFLIFIALSRIVVEAGVALVRAPLIPPDFVIASLGTSRLGAAGLTGLAYTYPWTADLVTFPMASCANGLKMVHEVIKGRKRGLFWGMMLAVVVTLVGGVLDDDLSVL